MPCFSASDCLTLLSNSASPALINFCLSDLVYPLAFAGLYPGAAALGSAFLESSLDAIFATYFAFGFSVVADPPVFLAAILANAAFFLSAFAASAAFAFTSALPRSFSGC